MLLKKQPTQHTHCAQCILSKKEQKGKIQLKDKVQSAIIHREGAVKIMIILEMAESINVIEKIKEWLYKKNIKDYVLVSALRCRTHDYDLPSPNYKIYNGCGCITSDLINILDPLVIIPFGRAIQAITGSSDIPSWEEFSEFQFNQTYFYTDISTKKAIRVYPVPNPKQHILKFTHCFERTFLIDQIKKVQEYITSNDFSDKFREPYQLEYVTHPNEFLKRHSERSGFLAWDIETNSLNHFTDTFKIGCITMTFDGITGYYLPFEKIDVTLLDHFFKNKTHILANGKYDTKALKRLGLKHCRVDHDITILFHMLSTERTLNGLKTLAWLVKMGGYDKHLDTAKEKYNVDNYLEIPEKILFEYSTLDAIATYRLCMFGLKLARLQPSVYDVYINVIIPVIEAFEAMELEGMSIDTEYLNTFNNELKKKERILEKQLKQELGNINLNSGEQLGTVLEEKLSLPSMGRTEKGYFRTGDEQLKGWKKLGFPIAGMLIEYKAIVKLRTAFVGEYRNTSNCSNHSSILLQKQPSQSKKKHSTEGLVKFINSDKKIHASFGVARTRSLRGNCSNPNLQQVPKQSELAKKYRPVYTVEDDFYFCEADYSGFQLRIGAIYSRDPVMKDIFLNLGGDMHSITAREVFSRDVSIDKFIQNKKNTPYDTYRFKSKQINFGFLFGRSAFSFKSDLEENWTDFEIHEYIKNNNLEVLNDYNKQPDYYLTVAQHMRNTFFQTYTSLEPWINKQHALAENQGYVDCPIGGRRHIPYLTVIGKDSDKKKLSNYKNIAVNSPVQSFEAITIYKAIIKIHNQIKKKHLRSRLLGMVHDSIVLKVHKTEAVIMYHLLKDAMEDHTTYSIPLLAEIEYGSVWGLGKEVTDENVESFLVA